MTTSAPLELEKTFPDSSEQPGHVVGTSENIRDALAFEVRDAVADHKVAKSTVHPANEPDTPNHCITFGQPFPRNVAD